MEGASICATVQYGMNPYTTTSIAFSHFGGGKFPQGARPYLLGLVAAITLGRIEP